MHRTPPGDEPRWSAEDELTALETLLAPTSHADPAIGRSLAALVDRLADNVPGDEDPVFSHGAFRTGQVLIHDDALSLLDLDTVSVSDPARDAGNALAYLSWADVRGAVRAGLAPILNEALLAGYADTRTALRAQGLAWWTAAAMAKIAGRRYRSLATTEWHSVPDLMSRAVMHLDSAGAVTGGARAFAGPVAVTPVDPLDRDRVTEVLRRQPSLPGSAGVRVVTARLLAEAAGRRRVVRYEVAGLDPDRVVPLIGKTYLDRHRSAIAYDNLRLLHEEVFTATPGLTVPTPVGHVPALRMLLYREVTGTALDRIPAAAGASGAVLAARWLSTLHTSGAVLARRLDLAHEVVNIGVWAACVGDAVPEARAAAYALADQLTEAAGDLPAVREVPVHKDLHIGHVLAVGRRVTAGRGRCRAPRRGRHRPGRGAHGRSRPRPRTRHHVPRGLLVARGARRPRRIPHGLRATARPLAAAAVRVLRGLHEPEDRQAAGHRTRSPGRPRRAMADAGPGGGSPEGVGVPRRVMYLVRSWPRLSQTFVVNEVLEQERLGTQLELYSLTRSGEEILQPQVLAVRAPVHYLDERRPHPFEAALRDHALVARSAPLAYARTLALAVFRPDLTRGYATLSALGCLSAAVRLAAAVHRSRSAGAPIEHLHAHFAHDPALVARHTNRLTGVPYSITAHARDLYQIPVSSLRARVDGAVALVTCCAANVDYLRRVLPAALHPRVRLIHHGVELERFVPATAGGLPRAGADRVGRATGREEGLPRSAACLPRAEVRPDGDTAALPAAHLRGRADAGRPHRPARPARAARRGRTGRGTQRGGGSPRVPAAPTSSRSRPASRPTATGTESRTSSSRRWPAVSPCHDRRGRYHGGRPARRQRPGRLAARRRDARPATWPTSSRMRLAAGHWARPGGAWSRSASTSASAAHELSLVFAGAARP